MNLKKPRLKEISLYANGGPHWDVKNKDGKEYDNVYPGGKVRPGKK